MISLELIFPETERRLFARVDESMTIGELKKQIMIFGGKNNRGILLVSSHKNITENMTLKEAGLHNGSGVIIADE